MAADFVTAPPAEGSQARRGSPGPCPRGGRASLGFVIPGTHRFTFPRGDMPGTRVPSA